MIIVKAFLGFEKLRKIWVISKRTPLVFVKLFLNSLKQHTNCQQSSLCDEKDFSTRSRTMTPSLDPSPFFRLPHLLRQPSNFDWVPMKFSLRQGVVKSRQVWSFSAKISCVRGRETLPLSSFSGSRRRSVIVRRALDPFKVISIYADLF